MARNKSRMDNPRRDDDAVDNVAVDIPPNATPKAEEQEPEWKKPFFLGLVGVILLILGWSWASYQIPFVSKRFFYPIPLALATGICPIVFMGLSGPAVVYRWLNLTKPEGKAPWKEMAVAAASLVPFYWIMLALLQISFLRIGWRETTLFTSLLAPLLIVLGLAGKMGLAAGKREAFTWIGAFGVLATLPVALYFDPSARLWTLNIVTLTSLIISMSIVALGLRFWVTERKQLNPFTVIGLMAAYTAGLGLLLWLLARGFGWTWFVWPRAALQWRVFTYSASLGFLFLCGYLWATLMSGELVAAVAITVALPSVAVWNAFAYGRKWIDYQWLLLLIPTAALVLTMLGIRKEHHRGKY